MRGGAEARRRRIGDDDSPAVSLTPEQLYLQLGSSVAEMPDLASGPITPEMNSWLGRAAALVEATGDTFGKVALTNAAHFLGDRIYTRL